MSAPRRLLAVLTPALLACATAHATPDEEATPEAAAAVVAPEEPAAAADDESPFGFSLSEGPLTINSEELDVDDRDGRRKIVFRTNVDARQGNLRVTCDRLEAGYPRGSKQPSRLVASENVRLTQGSQQVWCDEAVYDRVGESLLCTGNGRFLDGENELRGREIEIDLKQETVRVRGDARVVIQDEGPASPAPAAAAP